MSRWPVVVSSIVRLRMLLSSISRSCARSLGMRRYRLPLMRVGVSVIPNFFYRLDGQQKLSPDWGLRPV